MSFIGDSRRQDKGPGILPLQDHGYLGKNLELDERGGLVAVRLVDRLDGDDDVGHWIYDEESAGDVTGFLLWKQAEGRNVPGWAAAWSSMIAGGENPDPITVRGELPPPVAVGGGGGGDGGGGAGPPPDEDFLPGRVVQTPIGPVRIVGNKVITDLRQLPGLIPIPRIFVGINPPILIGAGGGPFGINVPPLPFNPNAGAVGNVPNVFGLGVDPLFPVFVFPRDPQGRFGGRQVGDTDDDTGAQGAAGGIGVDGDVAVWDDFGSDSEARIPFDVRPTTGRWLPDSRFQLIRPAKPLGWPDIPRGTQGITVAATDEDKQVEHFKPTDPRIVAPNFRGPSTAGTPVADMAADGSLDLDRHAPLQSQFRVVVAPTGSVAGLKSNAGREKKANWIARQIGPSGQWDSSGGLVCDIPTGEGGTMAKQSRILAHESVIYGGPLDVGHFGDAHQIGTDADGNPINSLHFSTGTLFKIRGDVIFDGPIDFEKPWPNPPRGMYPVLGHVGFDQGSEKWKIWSYSGVYRPGGFLPVPTVPPGGPGDEDPPKGPATPRPVPGRKGGKDPDPVPEPVPDPIKEPRPKDPFGIPEPGEFPEPTPERPTSGPGVKFLVRSGISSERIPRVGIATTAELMVPALAFRPQPMSKGVDDLRYNPRPTTEQINRQDERVPVVARLEAYGAQRGPAGGPHLPEGAEYAYTNRPGSSRYPGGDGAGGLVFSPPQVSGEDVDDDYAPPDLSVSAAYLMAAPGACLAVGTPELSTGGMRDGVSMCVDASGDMEFYSHDSVGDRTLSTTIGAGGVTRAIYTTAIDYIVAQGVDVVLVTADGKTVTIPDATQWEGRTIDVKSIAAGVGVTIATGGGTIDGDATQTLGEFDSITVISDGTNWWIL